MRIISISKQTKLIIDRYYGIDSQINSRRKTKSFFVRKLSQLLFPIPIGIILLGGDPSQIANRKTDMNQDAIKNNLENYEKYFSERQINFERIDTVSNNIEKCVDLADGYISELFARI